MGDPATPYLHRRDCEHMATSELLDALGVENVGDALHVMDAEALRAVLRAVLPIDDADAQTALLELDVVVQGRVRECAIRELLKRQG